jgi:hypothetical protein
VPLEDVFLRVTSAMGEEAAPSKSRRRTSSLLWYMVRRGDVQREVDGSGTYLRGA